jgi:hypothetical protein
VVVFLIEFLGRFFHRTRFRRQDAAADYYCDEGCKEKSKLH